jgi:hypothetical protein
MNKKKVIRPFLYPDSYVQFLAFIKIVFSISYRTVQGIVRGLAEYIKIYEIYFTQEDVSRKYVLILEISATIISKTSL